MLRRQLRRVLLLRRFGLQFIEDRVGIFDIPGLEIDTEVDGLMVVRGVTLRVSAMSLVVHGVEVGLKMVVGEGEEVEEIEIGIACEEVVVRLGRGIEVGDCFVSVKGGEGESSFKDAEDGTARKNNDEKRENEVWEVDSKMLRAVKGNEVEFEDGIGNININQNEDRTVKADMVDGHAPIDTDVKEGIKVIRTITPDDTEAANEQYIKTIQMIRSTNSIEICRQEIQHLVQSKSEQNPHSTHPRETVNENSNNDIRAAICSQLHHHPSITHPPSRSIKVTTLQTLAPPHIRAFLHRLPMLLRLLLNPLAHFHPVKISSLTATGSGKWIQEILSAKLFKNTPIYTPPSSPTSPIFSSAPFASRKSSNPDPTTDDDDESTIPKIQQRINEWLLPANFVLQLGSITALAQVPFLSTYDIHCALSTSNIQVYRTLPSTIALKQVVRLGGADATFAIPSFLLPHHDHILPVQAGSCKTKSRGEVKGDGEEDESTQEKGDDGTKKDECEVRIAAHAQLPIVMDQELLDWLASVVKASKVVEVEKEKRWMDEEIHGFRDLVGIVKGGVKDAHKGMKKTLVSATVNDRWIAKMVGKMTKKLEEAKGDIGYAGDIKVPLGPYRLREEARERGEGDKILP
ncbi:uncharacterized protein Bfra_006686 [Botrytis fragariae]|uniref:Uncharacterized protein n=1 Tax=Botrytis fragariae TaxID=1964551 RepID=A0A8H6B5C1_9HELO|nr:uncharacterized protein Bfra_006686 [Botrytis fragariae]KAF5879478.1 hypothetical protein Bfra_006686 [Botrytis fragariae]